MADVDELLVIDPADEGTGLPLVLVGPGSPYTLTTWRSPTPPVTARWAEPDDADGEPRVASRYGNRRFPHAIEIVAPAGPSRAADAQAALAALAAKYSKLNEEGGTLRRTLPSGDAVTWDVRAASDIDPSWEVDWDTARRIRLDGLELIAKPFGRGTRVSYAWHSTAGAPVLVFVEDGPAGDVPAIGELEVRNDSLVDQRWAAWSLQSLTYDPATTAELSFAAASLTTYPSPLPASEWKTILSTRLSATRAHLTHVGEYRAYARIRRGSARGTLAIALEYAVGDMLRFRRNPETTYLQPTTSTDERIVDLGIVSIEPPARGPHRWEGRIVARSSIDGDPSPDPTHFWLMPVERYGEVSANDTMPAPTIIIARDPFDQPSGALTGKSLPIGGSWTALGRSGADFVLSGSGNIARSATDATTDLPSGRIALPSGATGLAGVTVVITDPFWTGLGGRLDVLFGAVVRLVNVDNFLAVIGWSRSDGLGVTFSVVKRVAGVETVLYSALLPGTPLSLVPFPGVGSRLSVSLTASGALSCSISGQASGPTLVSHETTITGDPDLAVRGALATGAAGLISRASSSLLATVGASAIDIKPYAQDAVAFAGRTVEFAHDRVVRESVDGAVWTPMTPEGDYVTIPPAGDEGRKVRVAIKTSRSGIGAGPDPAIDNISGRLHVTPRYLVVP